MIELIRIDTDGNTHMINISDKIEKVLKKSESSEGLVNIFVKHTTAAVAIMEDEKGVLQDFKEAFERFSPIGGKYNHNELQDDDNASSHIRGSLLSASINIPFKNNKMLLGTWQQVFLVDFDTHKREREIVITTIESK